MSKHLIYPKYFYLLSYLNPINIYFLPILLKTKQNSQSWPYCSIFTSLVSLGVYFFYPILFFKSSFPVLSKKYIFLEKNHASKNQIRWWWFIYSKYLKCLPSRLTPDNVAGRIQDMNFIYTETEVTCSVQRLLFVHDILSAWNVFFLQPASPIWLKSWTNS